MQYQRDPVVAWCALPARRRFNLWLALAMAVVFFGSMAVYSQEALRDSADIAIHAGVAADFNFTDLHSITSRTTYPVWHLLTSALYQLGMPLNLAAGAVTALMKTLTFLFTYWLLAAMGGKEAHPALLLSMSLVIAIITGIRIPGLNPTVYRGVGSPNVWHNPTQQTVATAMMLVMPWLCHCWYCFERALDSGCKRYLLPWWKVLVLAALTAGSVACKPTFMQALLPAAFVMYLVELIRRPDQWRYFGQIVLGFVPAAGYFLLSYLYFTGVVVEFTSGVDVVFSPDMMVVLVRGEIVMCAAPILALITCWRKGMLKDRLLVLTLLMTVFSLVEGFCFHETGMRTGHGNFTWAANTVAYLIWAVGMSTFLRSLPWLKTASPLRKAGRAATWLLLAWHVGSSIYYLVYILTTGMAF